MGAFRERALAWLYTRPEARAWALLAPGGFWLVAFFLILTLGELYILPTGLGLFAKLAPPRLGATTVASWFLAIFSGSLLAGVVGTLWSRASHPVFFLLLAALAVVAAALLWRLDRPIRGLPGPTDARGPATGAA